MASVPQNEASACSSTTQGCLFSERATKIQARPTLAAPGAGTAGQSSFRVPCLAGPFEPSNVPQRPCRGPGDCRSYLSCVVHCWAVNVAVVRTQGATLSESNVQRKDTEAVRRPGRIPHGCAGMLSACAQIRAFSAATLSTQLLCPRATNGRRWCCRWNFPHAATALQALQPPLNPSSVMPLGGEARCEVTRWAKGLTGHRLRGTWPPPARRYLKRIGQHGEFRVAQRRRPRFPLQRYRVLAVLVS